MLTLILLFYPTTPSAAPLFVPRYTIGKFADKAERGRHRFIGRPSSWPLNHQPHHWIPIPSNDALTSITRTSACANGSLSCPAFENNTKLTIFSSHFWMMNLSKHVVAGSAIIYFFCSSLWDSLGFICSHCDVAF